jgi:hypothetical protein
MKKTTARHRPMVDIPLKSSVLIGHSFQGLQEGTYYKSEDGQGVLHVGRHFYLVQC